MGVSSVTALTQHPAETKCDHPYCGQRSVRYSHPCCLPRAGQTEPSLPCHQHALSSGGLHEQSNAGSSTVFNLEKLGWPPHRLP